jgi:hypothetical protein
VVVVSRGVLYPDTAGSDADLAGAHSSKSGNDVARDELILAQLDRREISVGQRMDLELEIQQTSRGRCAGLEQVHAASLAHAAASESEIGVCGI